MAFSEVSPFSKTGGLGDVGGALPKALKDMGHDVRVITPQYRRINERKYVLRDVIRLQGIDIPMAGEQMTVNVKSAFLPHSKVQVYFMDYRPYFFREGLYINPKTNTGYEDNPQRFILFAKGILETLRKLQWQPDVIHCNDWQTGLIPFFLKHYHQDDPFFSKIFSLLTVHNFAFQGNFDPDCTKFLNLPADFHFEGSDLDINGQCGFLKAGLLNADGVNTVSERHAKEAAGSEKFGFGMEKVLKKRKDALEGILNGIDEQVWNPGTDGLIKQNYTAEDLSGKAECRQALLEEFNLRSFPDAPVIAMISRLTEQKGLQLVQESFEAMMGIPVNLIVLGLGEDRYHAFLKKMKSRFSKQFSVHFKFDDTMAHRIMAGADMFLMPSLYEPCGLTQMYALKYGTVPVVFETGGLADTVRSFENGASRGNGFIFGKANDKTLMKTVKQAVSVYRDTKKWNQLMVRGMLENFSWEKAAERYVDLYHRCAGK